MGDTKFRQTGRRTAVGPFRADKKARKRLEGEERNAEWAALSNKEKYLDLMGRRRGPSTRQVEKIQAAINGAAQ